MGHFSSNMDSVQTNKMERFHHYLNDIVDLFLKGWIYIGMVLASLGTQFGYYLIGSKKESFRQIMGRFLMSTCAGCIIVTFCIFRWPPHNDQIPLQAIIVIPVGILMSDKIVKFLTTVGLKQTISIIKGIDYNAIMEIVFGDKKDKKD